MENSQCPICLESFDNYRELPCGHCLDEHCLKKCLVEYGFTCPVCRDQFEKVDITKFIETLPLRTNTDFNTVKCNSCNGYISLNSIKEHGNCILDLSAYAQKCLHKMTQQEVTTQENNFKEYCDWVNRKKISSVQFLKDYSSNIIRKVLEWKNNYCDAIEIYFQKELDNLSKLNANLMEFLEAKKSFLSNSNNLKFHNQVLSETARVDFTLRKEKVTSLVVKDISFPNQSDILASLLPGVNHLSQAVREFKDPPRIQCEFSVKSKVKESIPDHLSASSAMNLRLEKNGIDTKSRLECISAFELSSGKIPRAKILPNDTIITFCDGPNKLEMYDFKGKLLSTTLLNNNPEDMIVWNDNQLFICYQDTSFQLVTYANNCLNVQQELNVPQNYDSISSFGSGNILGKYAKNKCDILKIENNKLTIVETYDLSLSKVGRVYGYGQHCILYSGSNTSLMPDKVNCYNIQTGRETCIFPSSSNLSSENIKDFTGNDPVLFILDYLCHKVYKVNFSLNTYSVLLTEEDGIRNPFCVDINASGHLLVCYNNLKNPKLKIFNIN